MKIFYSWQSDLPGSDNRYFIQECIEKAASKMKDVTNVEVDRDTKNELGSPDIVNTIFAKIDECDLFVADISIINSAFKDDPTARMTPNPNVMLELGYAACKLGWDRVICLFNTDYAEIDRLPFDIRQRRITPYSIKENGKAAARSRIVDIICDTLKALQQKDGLRRSKGHYAQHKILCLNPSNKQFEETIHLHQIALEDLQSEYITQAEGIIDSILEIGVTPKAVSMFAAGLPYMDEMASLKASMSGYRNLEVSDDELTEVTSAIKSLLGKDIDKEILYFSGVRVWQHPLNGGCEYQGRDADVKKYEKYLALKRKLSELHVLNLFSRQFDSLRFIPLAIKNVSTISDQNLRIFVEILNESCEAVDPSRALIGPELVNNGGYICNYGFISKMFDADGGYLVSYDNDEVSDYEDDNPYINIWDSSPSCDTEECEEELCEYLATSVAKGVFEFSISDLRPNEIKWLGKWILVRNSTEQVQIKYSVTSNASDGSITGIVEQMKD